MVLSDVCSVSYTREIYALDAFRGDVLLTEVIYRYCALHITVEHKLDVKGIQFNVFVVTFDVVVLHGRRRVVHVTYQSQRLLSNVH